MKALVFIEPGRLELRTLPDPKPDSGEVILRTGACGVCGTDVHIFHGEFIASYPVIGGHEFAGEIVELGDDSGEFKPGDRVAVDPVLPCGVCRFCKVGRFNQCKSLGATGVTKDGAFAELVTVPASNLYPIGDLPYDEACFIEPLSCVLWGITMVGVEPGTTALIFGAGPIGLLLMQTIKHCGASSVTVVDLIHHRLDLAGKLGADRTHLDPSPEALLAEEPDGYELVVDATGVPSVVEGAFQFIAPGGKLLIFGVCPPEGRISLSPFEIYRKDITIVGSFSLNKTFGAAHRLVLSGAIKVKPLLSHSFPLEELPRALDLVSKSAQSMKVQIRFQD